MPISGRSARISGDLIPQVIPDEDHEIRPQNNPAPAIITSPSQLASIHPSLNGRWATLQIVSHLRRDEVGKRRDNDHLAFHSASRSEEHTSELQSRLHH